PSAPSEVEVARARENFQSAIAHAEAGRWPQAVLAFEESYRHSGNPVALLNLAVALREGGCRADARSCLPEPQAPAGAQLDAETRQRAEAISREVTAILELLGTLPDDASTTLDGVPQASAQRRFELDPGRHRLEITAEGHRPWVWQDSLVAGSVRRVTYAAEPITARARRGSTPPSEFTPVLAPHVDAPHADASHAPETRRLPRWAVGLLVGGAVAVAAAVALPLTLRNRGLDAPQGVAARYELP